MTDGSFQIGWTTYTPLTGDDAPWPHGPWQATSSPTDADDHQLAELRRRIVDPVVASVLTDTELESVVVFESPQHDIRATVTALDEESHHYLHPLRSVPMIEDDLREKAAQFACELEDFVAESRFAWGTQRIAVYEIPPA